MEAIDVISAEKGFSASRANENRSELDSARVLPHSFNQIKIHLSCFDTDCDQNVCRYLWSKPL